MLEVYDDGKPATWGDHITDDEYNTARGGIPTDSCTRRARGVAATRSHRR